jgi:MFS family permease
VLGILPSLANLTLASGTLFVGLSSERIGKIRMVGFVYLLAPILTIGLVYTPFFLVMSFFYVIRMAVANMARPATNSLYMSEISMERRGRTMAIIRIMWQFPRQTGTLFTAFLLTLGIFTGITEFGILIFPVAMFLYPVSVIPMYLAVRINQRKAELTQNSIQEIPEEGLEF